jgi:hypothetical protein
VSTLNEDPRYYCAPLETINAADLLGDIGYTLGAGPDSETHAVVHQIVDETDGIIAYALGEDVAQRIIAALAAVPEPDAGDGWYVEGPADPLDGDPLYWSNTDGWVSFQTADKYADRSGNLPDGGKWVPA